MSIIAWVFNWFCWNKKLCCCREYHNPTIKGIFWWISFTFLCGIIACCISGIVINTRFAKYTRVVQCAYERVYYDSEYGQITYETPKWEGLQNNTLKLKNSKILVNVLGEDEINKCFLLDENEWVENAKYFDDDDDRKLSLYKFRGKYYKPYVDAMKNLLKECDKYNQDIYNYQPDDNNVEEELFYDFQKPDNPSTTVGKLIYDINKYLKEIMENYEELESSYINVYNLGNTYQELLNNSINNFQLISDDLKNYKNGYLDSVEYYIKLAKACGHILTIIYFCILCLISIGGIILLLAYSYLKNQNHLDTFMHVVWNCIRFFELSFFLYGAAYGMLFKGLRDSIVYNKYLFGTNLDESTTTLLLPKKEAKSYLRNCLSEKNTAQFAGDLDDYIADDLNDFSSSYEKLQEAVKINYTLPFKDKDKIYLIGVEDESKIKHRILEEKEEMEMSVSNEQEKIKKQNEQFNFTTQIENYELMVKILIESFSNLTITLSQKLNITITKTSRILSNKEEANEELSLNDYLGFSSDSFDCSFLQNDLNLMYNALYDLSIQSRILCAISCCIAFFSEIFTYFYLLSIYHYNCVEFKEGNIQFSRRKKDNDNSEMSSKNEFMDKSKPIDMKKFNKKLDLEFSSK